MMAALNGFMALVLAGSALHKAADPARMAAATARLSGIAPPLAPVLLVLAGTLEALAAAGLLWSASAPVALAAAAGLWSAYGLALWRRRGQRLDCGCDLVARPRAVGPAQIARAAGLAGLALCGVMLPGLFDALPGAGLLDAAAAIGLFALYLAASEILAILAPAWRKNG